MTSGRIPRQKTALTIRSGMALFPVLLLLFCPAVLSAQPLMKRALFLGNSYTYVNNLPLLTAALAHNSGDSLYFDSHTPGGYTLGWQPIAHASDTASLGKIRQGGWDFVILQEQSQIPAITRLRDSCMVPASLLLYDSVKTHNPCARTLFYLTWGRRFGGIQCFTPNYCSSNFSGYEPMQDSVSHSYKMVADSLSGWIAPAGEAWRFVISHTGMVLHDADNSHPNLKGSYLAACVFYDVIFGKPSSGNGFTAGLDPDTALILQQAADSITFGFASLWNLNNDVPQANFTVQVSGDTLFTHNLCTGSSQWLWDFGDGQTSTLFEPVHMYGIPGTYQVKLIACNDCYCDSTGTTVSIIHSGIPHSSWDSHRVTMTGPDVSGRIIFHGYTGDGVLTLLDLLGRSVADVKVSQGQAVLQSEPGKAGCWVLTGPNGQVLARGKWLDAAARGR